MGADGDVPHQFAGFLLVDCSYDDRRLPPGKADRMGFGVMALGRCVMGMTSTGGQPRRDIERGENQATLRAIMTAPPMSATAHAAVARQRTAARRSVEDAHDRRGLAAEDWSA